MKKFLDMSLNSNWRSWFVLCARYLCQLSSGCNFLHFFLVECIFIEAITCHLKLWSSWAGCASFQCVCFIMIYAFLLIINFYLWLWNSKHVYYDVQKKSLIHQVHLWVCNFGEILFIFLTLVLIPETFSFISFPRQHCVKGIMGSVEKVFVIFPYVCVRAS